MSNGTFGLSSFNSITRYSIFECPSDARLGQRAGNLHLEMGLPCGSYGCDGRFHSLLELDFVRAFQLESVGRLSTREQLMKPEGG